MSKAWFIKFKRQIRGYDPDEASTCLDHPAVGRSIKHLDLLATAQGWPTLSSFLSEDPECAVDLLDEEDEDEVEAILKKIGSVRWFKSEDALATVERLIAAIEEMPRRISLTPKNVERIVLELKDLQQILKRAAEKNVPIRFYAEFG